MDGPINIEVKGKPDTCETNARWLHTLSSKVGGLSGTFGRTGGQSESFWHGDAGEAFRGYMSNAKDNAHDVEQSAKKAGDALQKFAEELTTVKERVGQAKGVASGAGLTVSDTEIQPPGPAPGPAPQAPTGNPSPQQTQDFDKATTDHTNAVQDHEKKVKAFNEASRTVSDARGKERAAHEALTGALKESGGVIGTLKTVGQTALTSAVSLTGGLAGASQTLLNSAEKNKALFTLATALRTSRNLSPKALTALQNAQRELAGNWAKSGFQKAQIDRVIGKIPAPVRNGLKLNLSTVTQKLFGIEKEIPSGFKSSIPVLKRLPVVGTALTAFTAGADIAGGADPTKTIEKSAGGLAAGMAVSAGVDAAVGGAIAAGLAVPGPGWVVAGTVALGAVASWGVGKLVDNYGDDINHAVGSAAHDVKNFVGDLF